MIARIKPAVVAFVGGTAYRRFFGRSVSAGPGAKPERIAGAAVFVVPNPSGHNAAYPGFKDKLVWYRRLRRYVEQIRQPDHRRGMPARSRIVCRTVSMGPSPLTVSSNPRPR